MNTCFFVFFTLIGSQTLMNFAVPSSGLRNRYPEVIKAEAEWDSANLHRDAVALRHILLPEFVQINQDGTIVTRDQGIELLLGSQSHPQSSKVEKRSIRIQADTAVLTAVYTEVGRSPKGFYRVVLNIADVFRYSSGAWKGAVGYAHLVQLQSGQPQALKLDSPDR